MLPLPCQRHRLVEPTPGGRRLCRAWRDQGEFPCPECSRSMPAGCGRRCWERLARRRLRIGSAGLASPVLAKGFGEFGAWLVEKIGERKVALNVSRHLEFFQQIEQQWGDIPDYAPLLQHFGAAGLRRHLTARRWMEEVGLITVDRAAREADSDRRRIEATLDRLPAGSKARDMLEEYGNRLSLRVRRGEITLRSMRLALTPAAKLLEVAAARRRLPPDQGTLDAFLRDAPGQASALNGFVSHLRRVHGAELTMPKRRDDVSLLFAVEQFWDRGALPPFSRQRPLEPFQHASLANVLDGLGAARKGVGDLLVGPRWPVRIGLQENLSAAHLLTAAVELAERLSTDLAFLGCESNDVPLSRHGNSLGSRRAPQ